MGLNELVNSFHELFDTGEGAPPDGFVGNDAKPNLDLVEPGGIGGDEVEVETRIAGHPKANFLVLVGGVVVDDEMDLKISGDVGIDVTQKLQKLLVAVAFFALGHHAAGGHV